MKSNDGYQLPDNSDIWVITRNPDTTFSPFKLNMYDGRATGRYWYYKEENCQKECDKLNDKQ